MEETLPPKARQGNLQLDIAAINPFGFIRLFKEGSSLLWKTTVVTCFQFFLEGKNMSDLAMSWMRDHLKWDVETVRNFVVGYGALCTASGMLITPRLLKQNSKRAFTTITNMLNFIGFAGRGYKAQAWCWLLFMIPMLPGVNAASATALKSYSSELARREGFGNGEFSAWVNNLRAIVASIAPMIYGQVYAFLEKAGMNPGHTFALAGLVGALTPEILMQTMLQDPELDKAPVPPAPA